MSRIEAVARAGYFPTPTEVVSRVAPARSLLRHGCGAAAIVRRDRRRGLRHRDRGGPLRGGEWPARVRPLRERSIGVHRSSSQSRVDARRRRAILPPAAETGCIGTPRRLAPVAESLPARLLDSRHGARPPRNSRRRPRSRQRACYHRAMDREAHTHGAATLRNTANLVHRRAVLRVGQPRFVTDAGLDTRLAGELRPRTSTNRTLDPSSARL